MRILLENPKGFALLGLSETENGTQPAGILIGTISQDIVSIDWLAVAKSLCGRGLGERLLFAAFKIAEEAGVKNVAAVMSDDLFKEKLAHGAQMYFMEHFFDTVRPAIGNIVTILGDMGKYEALKQDPAKMPRPMALSEIPADKRFAIVEKLLRLDGVSALYDHEKSGRLIDPEISFIFIDDDGPFGALLIQTAGDALMPVLYIAESDNEGKTLAVHAYRAALKKYGKDKDVFLKSHGGSADKLIRKMVSADEGTKLLIADIDSYRLLMSS
jgi:hypothetical protein